MARILNKSLHNTTTTFLVIGTKSKTTNYFTWNAINWYEYLHIAGNSRNSSNMDRTYMSDHQHQHRRHRS